MIVKHIYYILYYMALVETLTNTQRYELKKKIAELRSVKGEGTTLVTLAIKAGTTSVQMSSKIKDEIGLASNIKSAQTSKDVCDALESASNVLKKYSGSGSLEKGLIIFAGNGITMDGKPKRFNIGIEPPLPCPNPLYRCENHFKTEILEGMLIDKRAFGIIIIDRGSCFYELLVEILKENLIILHQIFQKNMIKEDNRKTEFKDCVKKRFMLILSRQEREQDKILWILQMFQKLKD